MTYFELIFAFDVMVDIRFVECGYFIVLAPFVEKTILFLLNCFGIFVKIQLTIYIYGSISGLSSVLLIYLFILKPTYCSDHYETSLEV